MLDERGDDVADSDAGEVAPDVSIPLKRSD